MKYTTTVVYSGIFTNIYSMTFKMKGFLGLNLDKILATEQHRSLDAVSISY